MDTVKILLTLMSDYIILTACNVVLHVLFILIFYASHCMSCTCPYVHVFISFSGVIKAWLRLWLQSSRPVPRYSRSGNLAFRPRHRSRWCYSRV